MGLVSDFLGEAGAPKHFGALKDDLHHKIWSTLRGFRQGLYYGAKIRIPHALVMTVLFAGGSSWQKLKRILGLTFQHARNLGSFVLIYKAVLALGRVLYKRLGIPMDGGPGRPAAQSHALVAGAIGGWMVWANYSSVAWQINLYLLSRIIVALIRLLSTKGVEPFARYNFKQVYPVAATGIWAVVLWLFEYHPEKLHPSLAKSMVELYHDSNTWRSGWRDFIPTPASALVIAFFTAQLSSEGKLMDLFDLSKTRL